MKTRIPSPARSLGPPVTPRRYKTSRSRSVGSPGPSGRPERLSAITNNARVSRGSFALTPLGRKSVLTDNTEIEEPRRKSWWKNLDDNSRDIMEVLRSDVLNNVNDVVEEYVNVEVLSQELPNFSLGIPDSSENETIDSIVLPQRRLFTEKENLPQKKFGKVVGARETLTKLQKTTTEADKTVNIGPKKLFSQGPSQRSHPTFPAGLLSTTVNKTAATEEPIAVAPKKLFGQEKGTKKKTFTNLVVETSVLKSDHPEQKTTEPKTLFNKDQQPKSKPIFPTEPINVSPNKTAQNKTKEASEIQGQVRNLFGNKAGTKRKNIFADLIVSESEDDIQDVQPKVFGFTKSSKSRGSSVSRGVRDGSPMSITTDIELDDWKMLPSSTMMVEQLEEMVAGTPVSKKIRLSKLSEQKESDGSKASTTINKTKTSNRSLLKNKSKTEQNISKSEIVEDNMVIDEVQVEGTEKQNMVEPQTEDDNVLMVNENNSNVQDNCENAEVNTNATYNIKNRTHSIHKNASKLSKTNTEIEQQEQVVSPTDEGNELQVTENNETKSKSVKEANTQVIEMNENDDEEHFSLTYEEDLKEPIVEAVQDNQAEDYQELDVIINTEDKLTNNIPVNKQTNAKDTEQIEENQKHNPEVSYKEPTSDDKKVIEESMEEGSKTEKIQTEQVPQAQNTSVKEIVKPINDYADDNFEDPEGDEINVSVLQDEVSEVIPDNIDESRIETSIRNKEAEVEESIELIQKEIDRSEEEVDEKEQINAEVETNQVENIEQGLEGEQCHEEMEHEEIVQSQAEIEEDVKQNEEDVERADQSEAEVEQTQEEIEEEDEELEEAQEEIEQEVETEEEDVEVEQSQEEVEQEEEIELEDAEVEQSEEEIPQDEEEQDESEVEQSQDDIEQEDEIDLDNSEVEQCQEEIEQDEEEQDEAEVEQVDEDIEPRQEEIDQDDEEAEIDQEMDENNDIAEESHASMPSERVQTPERINVSHDTTGRNRKKIPDDTQIKSPEAILKGTTLRNTSFTPQGRNTSVRKTKSMIRPQPKLSLAASIRDSMGSNGSSSSAQGSGWDSHRTTRKTMRQTFGKDFTPRKSLRALVMEKSAQRQTLANIDVDNIKVPQANSTEINANDDMSMPSMVDNVEDPVEDTASEHEVSRNTRQTTLEMYLQKLKKDTLERKMRIEESLKAPTRDVVKEFNFKVPRNISKPARPKKPKAARTGVLQLGALPRQVIEAMQYKPPKRFSPANASWTTNRLYKFLDSKLEPKYDYKARVRSEKLMQTLYSFSKLIQRADVAPQESIDQLKHEMARLNVTRTHFEFYEFFHEYMPREMRIKVIPDITNKLPMPKYGIDADIIR